MEQSVLTPAVFFLKLKRTSRFITNPPFKVLCYIFLALVTLGATKTASGQLATLTSLSLTGNGSAVTLSPSFSSAQKSYTATTSSLTVTLTAATGILSPTIVIDGTTYSSSPASSTFNLSPGSNTITVVVSNAIHSANTYTIAVTETGTAITSVSPASANPTNANSVDFNVAFSGSITGLSASNFSLATTGTVAGTIAAVNGSGSSYTVTVNNLTGDGTLGLNLASSTGVTPAIGPFSFTGGTYTLQHTPPFVTSIIPSGTNPTNAGNLNFQVTFSEGVTGVDASDFTAVTSGVSASNLAVTQISPSVYTVSLNAAGSGTVNVNLNNGGTGIADLAGNAITTGYTQGETYSVDNITPTISPISYSSNDGAGPLTAVTGDVITLAFSTSEAVKTPAVTVAGHNITATSTDNINWTASYTLLSTDTRGRIPFTLQVRDMDGNNSSIYTDVTQGIDIELGGNSSTLSALAVNQGTLNPAFSPTTVAYVDTVANGVSAITITPTPTSSGATVTVNGAAPAPVSLNTGNNAIPVAVTSPDGSVTGNYTVNVNRLSLAPTISSFSPQSGAVGTVVTINGTNLSPLTSFTIGGQNAIVISNTGSALVGMVMPNSASGVISLATAQGSASSAGSFTITPTLHPASQLGSKLAVSGSAAEGSAVVISADGKTVAIGNQSNGVTIMALNNGVWSQQGGVLIPSDEVLVNGAPVNIGSAMGLSADGNTLVAAAKGDNDDDGATWIFTRSNGVWTQQGAKLIGSGAQSAQVEQGYAVAISADGNTMIECSPFDNNNNGSIWVFTRSNGVWAQLGSKLTGTNATRSEIISLAISADGETIAGGGSGDNSTVGAAWIFTLNNGVWSQQGAKLVGTGLPSGSQQASNVALSADGNTLLSGDQSGGLYVFSRTNGTWAQQGAGLAGTGTTGTLSGFLHCAISADGNTAIEGNTNDNGSVGALWSFTRSNGVWTQDGSKMVPSGYSKSPSAGSSLALMADGSMVITGGPADGNGALWFFSGSGSPSVQASDINFSNISKTSGTVSWAIGNGSSRAVFISQSPSGSPSPVNSTTYIASTTFGMGTQIGSSGWYCIYNGTGTDVNISGLTNNTTYNVAVVDYNGIPGDEQFITNSATGDPATFTTLPAGPVAPIVQASALGFTNTTPTGTTVNWTSGNGASEAVFVATGSPGSPSPVNNTTYTANTTFGSGSQVGSSGWYCVYNGATPLSGTASVGITGLTGSTTYNVMVVDYNGAAGSEQYLTTASGDGTNPGVVTTSTPPTINNVTFTSGNAVSSGIADYGDQVTLNFTTSEAVQTPLVTIGSATSNDNVTLTANGGNSYTATYSLAQWDSPDASGNVPYTIAVTDLSGNTANYSELTAGAPNITFNTKPSISETGTLPSLTTALNQPSLPTTFTVSGVNIQSDVTVTAPAGFEVSTVNYNFSPMAYLDVTGGGMFGPGTLAPITVYVRMQSSASPGMVSGNITLTSNEATEVDVPVSGTVGAAAPTTQASSVTFANTTTTQTAINWTQGNGTNEVVFIAPTDSVSAAPTLNNNTTYNANATYRAGGQDGSGSYYCVFNGADGSVSPAGLAVDHLTPGENYTVYVFDYNGTPGSEQYTTATASGNPATVTTLTPNNATVGLMDNGQTAISFTVNFSNPSISGLNVNNFTVSSSVPGLNPVVTAVNYWGGQVGYQVLVSYNSNYNGTVTLTLANSTGITPAVTNLPQSYTFTATVTAPFNQASQVNFSNTTSSATTINWTSGGGSTSEAVFISQGNSGSPSPVNNTTYNANAAFGSGDQIGSSGWYCVYNGAPAASVNVSGLSANTTYNVMVVDYNGVAGGEQYLTSTGWNNPATVTTQSTDATLSNITVSQGSLDQSFSPTTLSYTEELVYDGSPFTLTPVPNNANATVSMTFSNIYNTNAPLNGGVFMAYGTNTFNITVTSQDGSQTLQYSVVVTTTKPVPTTQASNVTVTNTSQTGTTINWTPGNGTSEAVFLENSSVHGSPSPVNNTTYTASTVFQSGTQIGGSGWYCVYNGTGSSSVSVTGLTAGSPYQVMVVDYDGAPGSEQYLTTSASGNPLAFPTLSAPELFTGTVSGTISACAGTASASPNVEQFSVSGNYLTDNITVTAPTGFEVSTDGASYGSSVTITQNSGTVNSTTVYARSAASDAAGVISGNAVVSSSGASSLNVGLSGTVNALSTITSVSNQTIGNGAATAAVNFTGTGASYTWTNDTPGIGLAASGSGNIASFTAVNTGASPVTATITATPVGGYSYAYIANNAGNNVSVINTANNTVVATINVGHQPYGVAVSPDGTKVYVTNSGDGTVSVINTATNVVTATITVGTMPRGIAVSPSGSRVYVANSISGSITVLNGINNQLVTTITGISAAQAIALTPGGGTIYVEGSVISQINTSTYMVTRTFSGGPAGGASLVVSPDSSAVYVGNGTTVLGVINTGTNTIATKLLGRIPNGGMALSADGFILYLGTQGGGVQVYNTGSATVIASITTSPLKVYGVSLSADGSTLYAALGTGNTVDVISTAARSVIRTITVGSSPESFGNFLGSVTGCNGAPTTFTFTVNPSPTITTTNTLTALSTTAGTASASTSFNVSATWLQSGIVVTPPAGFEVSTDGNTYSSTVTLTGDNTGTLASTPVYVRLASADAAGSYSGNVQLTSTNATTATEAASGTVLNPAPTTVASNVGFTSTTTTATTINWTPGNGSNEVVFIASAPAYPPLAVNNTTYAANTAFGTGSWQCVFNGSGNSVNVTGLTPGATYNVYVFDYDGAPGSEQYLDNLSTNTGAVTTSVLPVPSIASFSPESGPVGTLVTITGSNLSSPTAFTIGGQPAIVISNEGSTLVAMVMPNATTGAVSLTTSGGTASGSGSFTITQAVVPNTQQGARLTETGGSSYPQLGASVALSADGNTALIGAPSDNSQNGDAVVFTRAGSAWTQSAILTGSGSSGGFFGGASEGHSVALSADGNTAVVGGNQDGSNEGAVWVFIRSGSSWTQQGSKLVGTDAGGEGGGDLMPGSHNDQQGTSVALSADGNTLVEGGSTANSDAGAAWVFTRSGGAWTQAAQLSGTGGSSTANQGRSVAISADGGTILVGGSADNGDAGAVWVFTGGGSTWTQQGSKLTPSDGNMSGGGIYFGTSAALSADGNTAVIGGPADASLKGASWVFTRSGGTWAQQGSKLFGSGAVGQSQQGWSLAVSADGNTLTEGALEDNDAVGATWVFTRNGLAWTQQGTKLVGTGGSGSGSQGTSVAISADGTTAAEGASVDNGGVGAAWVFTGALSSPETITFNALSAVTYGAADFAPGATSTNSNVAITYSSDNANVASIVNGNIHIIAAGSANIKASQAADATHTSANDVTQQLTVNQAPLTITANSVSVPYGQPLPTFTPSYNAFVNGDDYTKLTTQPQFSTVATSGSAPGQYTISVSGAADANYSIGYISGLLTIIASTDASLSGISLSSGKLSPAFSTANTGYAVNVANSVSSVTITPATTNGSAGVTVNGVSATTPVSLSVGQTIIPIVVTAQDGTTIKTYTVTVTRAPSTNASLSAFKISNGTLSPAFAAGTTSYTAGVGNGLASMTVTPIAADPNATITVNGTTVTSGTASGPITLTVGPNAINTVVTAQDGTTIKTYTLTVTRAPSTNASLSAFNISNGTLSPAFAPGTTSYAAGVGNELASMTVTPTAADPTATITVNGTAVTSGSASQSLPLVVGPNNITIIVTAQDGVTIKTYTFVVTVAKSTDANLLALKPTPGPLSPAFSATTTAYTESVANTVSTITITPTTTVNTSTVTVNGTTVTSGTASGPIMLNVGPNAITTVVTAQDGTTIKTYTVMVTRPPSANASLSAFKISNGTLSPAFAAGTTSYTAGVGNGIVSMTVTPIAADPTATITVNGTAVTSGTASGPIALNVGPNAINTVVTAQDGTTIKTYTVTVTRAPSTNASLSAFKISNGTLSPAFAAGTTSYTAGVGNGLASMTVTPTVADPNATITVNGTAVTSGSASQSLPLVVGPNTITTIVTAQDGVTIKTYTLVVTKAKSTNDNLLSLKPSSGSISPTFSATTTAYTESVANTVSTITTTPTTAVNTSTVTVNGTAVTSGTASGPITLNVGPNAITTVVTAQDGTTIKTYTLTVTRASGSADSYDPGISVTKPTETPTIADDGILVHQAVSPNGDGINDFLQIDNISQYPDNKLMIMNRNGQLIFETKGYDNSSKVFDGHSSKSGQMQLPGTYFYQLDYTMNGITKHKTGFLVLKY